MLALATASSLDSTERAGAALIVLQHQLRPDSADTLRFFAAQQVSVRVFSGDSPASVGAVAAKLGVPGADRPADGPTAGGSRRPGRRAGTAPGRRSDGPVD